MARTRKTAETRLAELSAKKAQLQAKIENWKGKISELDSQIKDLTEARKQKELEQLLKAIKDSGKTPEEVLSALHTEENEQK